MFHHARLLALAASSLLGWPEVTRADIDETLTKQVWQMLYRVPEAKANDPAWLLMDDDGDGASNGAEIAAGTDPFKADSVVKVSGMQVNALGEAEFTFPTVANKKYFLQFNGDLTNSAGWSDVSGKWTMGGSTDGESKTLSSTFASNTFYRIRVVDLDTDNDGLSDWTEKKIGYRADRPDSATAGSTIAKDRDTLISSMAASNKVSVVAQKLSATQPVDSNTPPVETASIVVSRSGTLNFSTVVVPLQWSGTAQPNLDYDELPTSVTFGPRQNSIVLTVNPRANSARITNVTATVTAKDGVGYVIDLAKKAASVVINPAGIANGTGLSGAYYNTSSATYTTQVNTFATTAQMSRVDATVDFSTGVNGWGATGGPVGMSPVSSSAAFSVRWTGQLLPEYSETYFIDFRSDDSAKVWVNGTQLVDRWVGQGATDYASSIELKAGVRYDIQIDYWNSSGGAEARLYWWSASQPKQIIPQKRLFPSSSPSLKAAPITNSLAAIGYVGTPFKLALTNPKTGGVVTYAVDDSSGQLPPGLSLDSATGLISGIPTSAGSFNVVLNAINTSNIKGSSVINFTIHPIGSVTREILVNGAVINDGTVASLDDDQDYPSNTSRRLRGYLVPPRTGNYYFWIAASNAAEFYLSNDAEYVNKVLRASVTGSTGKKVWNSNLSRQQSPWISLVAGQKYYFEALHNTGLETDCYLSVGWLQDDVGIIPATASNPNPTGTTQLIANGGDALQGFPLSGNLPSYVTLPYDYPTVVTTAGALYAANLGPQSTAATKASGSANLRVDPSNTFAVLHFNYSGLSSARTAYHLHIDQFDSHPQGEIIYDIDDIDSFHPELKTADGGYIWQFAPVGTFTAAADLVDAVKRGKVYLNIHTVNYGAGEIRGTLSAVEGSQTPPDGSQYPEPAAADVAANDAHAARFLNQASFGASPADLALVKANGFAAWISNQLGQPASRTSNDVVAGLSSDINTPYPSALFTDTWWKYSISGPDQLRQRLAFALSEIMVVSWANNTGPLQNNGRVLADYYDTLLDYCLPTPGLADSGTFRGVLKNVTLTPAMGLYLDMRNNQKEDLTIGRHPNENYAREIMQLFSIGINRMWDDGKFVLNSNADVVPTYTQPNVLGLASLLTGWSYAQSLQSNGRLPASLGNTADYLNAMMLVPKEHDFNAKLLLNNVMTPAASGRTPRASIASVAVGNPACAVTTVAEHGLRTGDTVTIAGAGGTYTTGGPINGNFQVTVTSAKTFTVPVTCTAAGGAAGTVTGATVVLPAYIPSSGLSAISGSQSDTANVAYDQYGTKELDAAIDNIVNHDNVAPYICRQLIQRLVTSYPSPGYVYRVVQKFKNNGSGVRGDLAAVVTQILLDGEARGGTSALPAGVFGKQREPMLRLTAVARAFPAQTYTGTYTQLSGINASRLRIVTNAPNDFNAGFNVSLNFRANYASTNPPNPSYNPTSTTYGITTTLGVAGTSIDVSGIAVGSQANTTVVSTVQPHGLTNGNSVTLSGVSGTASPAINGTFSVSNVSATSFTIPVTLTRVMQVASVGVGNPCTITTAQPHGMAAGNSVTLNGIVGGTFSTAINATFVATVTGPSTFTVPDNCLAPPTSIVNWRHVSSPCRITTASPHGLNSGDSVTISGISGGTFTPAINNTYLVTTIDPTSFTIPVNCTVPSTNGTGTLVGANTMDVNATGMVSVAYSQPAKSNVLTISAAGPQTDIPIPVPKTAKTSFKSQVYLLPVTVASSVSVASIATGSSCTITTTEEHGLTTGASVTISGVSGGSFNVPINGSFVVTKLSDTSFTVASNCTVAPTSVASAKVNGTSIGMPGAGVYDVQTNSSSSFTVFTTDIPAGPRSGTVIIPKIATSYTPLTSNTVVQFNTNVNHNLVAGQKVWVDVPVVGNPLVDGVFTITETADEDHCKVASRPDDYATYGTYPLPSGANNGVNLWPLVAPPLGRSGNVSINQSTFSLGSTEGTLSQSPLNSPTVFNFFFPDYKFPGSLANSGIDSPEFQLSTDTNLSNLTNSLTNMMLATGGGNTNLNGLNSFNGGGGSVVVDIGPYMTVAKTSNAGISGLVTELANALVGGPLDAATRSTIETFVASNTNFPMNSPTPTNAQMRDRVRAILHLIITSAEFAVQK